MLVAATDPMLATGRKMKNLLPVLPEVGVWVTNNGFCAAARVWTSSVRTTKIMNDENLSEDMELLLRRELIVGKHNLFWAVPAQGTGQGFLIEASACRTRQGAIRYLAIERLRARERE